MRVFVSLGEALLSGLPWCKWRFQTQVCDVLLSELRFLGMPSTHRSTTSRPLSDLKRSKREDVRLRRALERERSRIDRHGGQMTLLIFHFERPAHWPSRKMKRLLAALDNRSRITDEIGQIDRSRAFVLLPGTAPSGGHRLAEDIVAMMQQRGIKVDYVAFRYVSARPRRDKDSDEDNRGNGLRASDRSAEQHEAIQEQEPVALASASVMDHAHCLVQHFSERLPWWKRLMDIVVSVCVLLAVSPLLLLVALAIKLDSAGPVFFRQERMGVGRSRFMMWKFRTMVVNAEAMRDSLLDQNEQDGPAFKIRRDPRITRLGTILRKTSIDELPQLINVLRGEMTLVGPRPLPVKEAEACESWQDRRHTVYPGLTCIWQVGGRSQVSFDEWARMDVHYTKRVSLLTDIKILAKTVPAVIKQEGS